MNGSAVAVNWSDENIPAILEAWYTGQEAGTALADVIFGDYNPAGRLPVTFYKSVDQLPPFRDYDMQNRTYKYFTGTPLYSFGYGLSYSSFDYENLQIPGSSSIDSDLIVKVYVTNTSDVAGEEVVQVYISDVEASVQVPNVSLRAFRRIALDPGETKTVELTVQKDAFTVITESGARKAEPGLFKVYAGGVAPVNGREKATTTEIVEKTITLE